jgi:hypothetical protein
VRTLSKSDYKLARSCSTKLFYRESGYPDSRSDDPYLTMLAEGGYMVEALAKAQRPEGVPLEYGGDPTVHFAATMQLLERERVTLFEGTLLVGRYLARVDILEKKGATLRLIEVKAKSYDPASDSMRGKKGKIAEAWREYLEDITYQVMLLQQLLPDAKIEPRLLMVDKSKRAQLDGIPGLFEILRKPGADGSLRVSTARYTGPAASVPRLDLLVEVDVSAEVAELLPMVRDQARVFEGVLEPLTKLPPTLTAKCRDCEFGSDGTDGQDGFRECWGPMADVKPHILNLYQVGRAKGPNGGPLVEELALKGKASLFDIDEGLLVKADGTVGKLDERRLIQIRHARSGKPFFGSDLRERLDGVEYPLHFVDFETSRLALPYHENMRPYGLVAFQWSCHTIESPGAVPSHSEWLNNDDTWPNADFAVSLRKQIGDRGSVLTWAHHEATTMRQIAALLGEFNREQPGLSKWLGQTVDGGRILDLNDLTRSSFFYPGMGGRTSIKVVLDTLWKADPAMREQFTELTGREGDETMGPYVSLPPIGIAGVPQDVHEGTGAMRAYQEMMYGEHRNDDAARDGWSQLLKQYCELDTLAMVLIWEYWRRNAPVA